MSIEKYDAESWEIESIPYTILPNNVLQNFTQHPDALALWAHLMSLPKDWNVNKKYIMNKFCWGKDKTEKTLVLLKMHNLLEHKTLRNEDGTVNKVIIIIKNGSKFDTRLSNNDTCATGTLKTQVPDVSGTGYQPPTNTILNINTNIKDINTCASDDARDGFDDFWNAHPVKKNKSRAISIWTKNKLYKNKDVIIAHVKKSASSDSQWLSGYAPHPDTYLRGKQWEDEILLDKPPIRYTKPSEVRSTVKDWAPGNPDYDRVNCYKIAR